MAQLIKKTSIKSILKLSITDGTKAYRELRQQVVDAGILNGDYCYYIIMVPVSFTGFFLSLYYISATPLAPILVFWGISLAFFTVQLAGILHDAGHRAIFVSSRNNDILGSICGVFI